MRSRRGGASRIVTFVQTRLLRIERRREPDREFDRAADEALTRARELEAKAQYLRDRVNVISHR